ncbi:hypothetical protein C9890_0478 [Perkinsus sp. BL_2016]|nr:hypothetical protein C9890_0478 [Perkinsus sp. BL_2016]
MFFMNSFFSVLSQISAEAITCVDIGDKQEWLIIGTASGYFHLAASSGQGHFELNTSIRYHESRITAVAGTDRILVAIDWNTVSVWSLTGSGTNLLSSANFRHVKQLCVAIQPGASCVCLGFEDGVVRVISLHCKDIWSANLDGAVSCVEWSPDGLILAIGVEAENNHVALYDSSGVYFRRVKTPSIDMSPDRRLVGLSWGISGLAMCFSDGKVQITRSIVDEDSTLIDCLASVVKAKWSLNGTTLAIASMRSIFFFSATGLHLSTLALPGTVAGAIIDLAWQPSGSGIFVALEASVCFAYIPKQTKKFFVHNQVAVSSQKDSITIYPSKLVICVPNLLDIIATSSSRAFFVITRFGEVIEGCLFTLRGELKKRYRMLNGIAITGAASTGNFVVVTSASIVQILDLSTESLSYINIGDTPWVRHSGLASSEGSGSADSIVDVAASGLVAIARESGLIHIFNADLMFVKSIHIETRPEEISFNCDSSMIAVIDYKCKLLLIDVESSQSIMTSRAHCWDIVWALDDPTTLACMDENKLYLLRGKEGRPEEPLMIEDNILIGVEHLEIITVNESRGKIEKFPSKSLRDCSGVIKAVSSLDDAFEYIARRPHERLWITLAEHALLEPSQNTRFDIASKCYQRANNQGGEIVVEYLQSIEDPVEQRMNILLWLNRVEDCENLVKYRGRDDLWLRLKKRTSDFEALSKSSNWSTVTTAREIADHFFMNANYILAADWYMKQHPLDHLSRSHLISLLVTNQFEVMCSIAMNNLMPNDPMLIEVARMARHSGLCKEAAALYAKVGKVDEAMSVCAEYKRWDILSELEHSHRVVYDKRQPATLVKEGRLVEALEMIRHVDDKDVLQQILLRCDKNTSSLVEKKKIAVLLGVESGCWRRAEALHFLILVQGLLYRGSHQEAFIASTRLTLFEEVLSASERLVAYKLQAACALLTHQRTHCSKAMTQLEIFGDNNRYRSIALKIFSKPWEISGRQNHYVCPDCQSPAIDDGGACCVHCDTKYKYSLSSGRICMTPANSHTFCSTCRSLVELASKRTHCNLCHHLL